MKNFTTKHDTQSLSTPKPTSHKWQNGSVLVIGGSHRYHGAPLLAVSAAARFVDIVHFACDENYKKILPRMRGKLFEFIPVFSRELKTYVNHVDVVLLGPGLELHAKNQKLVRSIQKQFPKKRLILDAGAFRLADLNALHNRCIVSPNQKEFLDIFGATRSPKLVKKYAKKFRCTILAKGPISYIASPTAYAENHTGNQGLTKGGTGDVLAGLLAAFFTKNNPFLSAKAASFLLGKTAEQLWESRGYAFSATDLLQDIPLVFRKLTHP